MKALSHTSPTSCESLPTQARIQDFLKGGGGEGQGGPLRGGVIAPVGEKLLFEHTQISATRGGG